MKIKFFLLVLSITILLCLSFVLFIHRYLHPKINKIVHINIGNGCGSLYEDGKLIKIKPQYMPLKILYEDENMLVVYKPSGILTHPNKYNLENTLVNALLYKYGENLSDASGELCRGVVHRLDKNTSGILMIAKNNKAHLYLKQKLKEHEVNKYYYAIVKGIIKDDKIIIDKPIGKHPFKKFKMAINNNGKESITIVKVLKRFENFTLVEVQIITGRTHQIRVHLASIGHPVYNDEMYGSKENLKNITGQALMSYKLIFPRPYDGKLIEIKIPMDDKLTTILNIFNAKNNHK